MGGHRTGAGRARAEALGELARQAAWGEVAISSRGDRGSLWIARGDELVSAEVDLAAWEARAGDAAAPIDTAVHAWLYREHPRVAALVRIGDGWIDRPVSTAAARRGARAEAIAIQSALVAAAIDGRWDGGDVALDLAGRGTLLALTAEGADAVADRWDAARAVHVARATEIAGAGVGLERLEPVLSGATIAGSLGRLEVGARECVTLHVEAARRGRGLGDRLVTALGARDLEVAVADGCGLLDYYVERGWRVLDRAGALVALGPPDRRIDLRQAGSICLLNPLARRVLIGRRRVEPWQDYWAFPGGGCEPGESRLDAARRELVEETGVVARGEPLDQRVVHVGSSEGERVYAVENFVFSSFCEPQPRPTAELDAIWVDLDEATALRPMAAGTRRVIRSLLWWMEHGYWG